MATGKHTNLAIELEKDILAGRYGWEGGLPGASELAQTWNMSINTVKNALSLLEGKNLIEKRGIGYYINRTPTVMTQHVPSAHIRLEKEGYNTTVGPVKRVPLPENLANKIKTEVKSVVYRVQVSGEIVEGNERPLQIANRYYLLAISDEKLQRMQNDATYDPMWNDEDVLVELLSHDEVTPRLATEGERDILNLPETTPISNVFETISDTNGKLLMVQEVVLSPRTTLIFDFPFKNQPKA